MTIAYPLTRALRLDEFEGKPIVAFVGGGGKTTTMFALASELAAQGRRVVTTTTTRLFAAQRMQSPAWCAFEASLDTLMEQLDVWGQCLVTSAEELGEEKARGLDLAQVAALAAHPEIDALLIEADGSRARPFKAPAPHEPVIPAETSHVVALVGADVFGKALGSEQVHRPERVATLGGVAEGTPITPDLVARVLTHAQGGLQYVPDSAYFIPFLNKIENEADEVEAEQTARLLLTNERVREVLLGSLHRLKAGQDALARRSRSAAIILAAGQATRFGETKQLLEWQGRALVAHVAEIALAVCETVLVVAGYEAERVARAVAHLPVEVIYNEHFATGQGSSVAAGVAALMDSARPFIGEAFFMVADQPFVTPTLLGALQGQRGLYRIAVPRHEGQRGNPVLFDAALFPALRAMTGDVGGRALFETNRDDIAWFEVGNPRLLRDVDTREEWEEVQQW